MSYYPYQPPAAPEQSPNYYPAPQIPPAPSSKPERVPGFAAATACFLLVVILFNAWAVSAELVFKLKSLWITAIGEFFIVALIPILFALLKKYNLRRVFSLNRIGVKMLFLCALAGLAAQFLVRLPSFLSNWFLQILGGPLYLPDQFDDNSPLGVFVTITALLILAPLCEETLNRGFVMAGYRKLGFWKCALAVGIFFGLFHQYPYRFFDTMCAGIILAYIALVTGSIFGSMAAHFGFNFLPTIVLLVRDKVFEVARQTDPSYNFTDSNLLLITGDQIIASLLMSFFGGALVFLLLRAITKQAAKDRPGLVLNYSGLATEIVEGASSYENGEYYGPANLPYRYAPIGYLPIPAPFPLQPITSQPIDRTRPKLVTAGWIISGLLLLGLFAFTSFSEFQLRAKGRDYCRQHSRECATAVTQVQDSGFKVQIRLELPSL